MSPHLQPSRRYDLDWLCVVAVLLPVPFHSAIIFSSLPQTQVVYVYDSHHSPVLIKTDFRSSAGAAVFGHTFRKDWILTEDAG